MIYQEKEQEEKPEHKNIFDIDKIYWDKDGNLRHGMTKSSV